MRGYFIICILSLSIAVAMANKSQKHSRVSGRVRPSKGTKVDSAKHNQPLVDESDSLQMLDVDDEIANITDDVAMEQVLFKLKARVANALDQNDTNIDEIMIKELANEFLSNSTIVEFKGKKNESICCSTGVIFGELLPQKKCMLPGSIYHTYKAFLSKKCMHIHAKCCEKIRGNNKRGKETKLGKKKKNNLNKKVNHKKPSAKKHSASKKKTTPSNSVVPKKRGSNNRSNKKSNRKKFSKSKRAKDGKKNVQLDDKIIEVEITPKENEFQLPDETGQEIIEYATVPPVELTFDKQDPKFYKHNYKKCCAAGKAFKQSGADVECELGSITDEEILVDELCLTKFSYCCKKASSPGVEDLPKVPVQKVKSLTGMNAAGTRLPTRKAVPKRHPAFPGGGKRRDDIRVHPSGHYYYVDKVNPDLVKAFAKAPTPMQ